MASSRHADAARLENSRSLLGQARRSNYVIVSNSGCDAHLMTALCGLLRQASDIGSFRQAPSYVTAMALQPMPRGAKILAATIGCPTVQSDLVMECESEPNADPRSPSKIASDPRVKAIR
jgi:hypothetical protein